MLSIARLAPGAAEYYLAEAASPAEDYYVGGETMGRWAGSLAGELGLSGPVDADAFRRVLAGAHPWTGEAFATTMHGRSRASATAGAEMVGVRDAAMRLGVTTRQVRRLLATGTLAGERTGAGPWAPWRVSTVSLDAYRAGRAPVVRRPGFDVTLRPPKSVSVLWALAEPAAAAQVVAAHRDALTATIDYLEAHAVRARRGQRRDTVVTGGVVAALFEHLTSRAGDPLVHTHVVVANVTRCEDGAWRALDARPLYRLGRSAGFLYQAHLRHELTTRLGVAWGPVVNGGADIAGIPRPVIDAFSKRRAEIEAAADQWGVSSPAGMQIATLATRTPKDRNVDAVTLGERWRAEAAALGFDAAAVAACLGRAVAEPIDETGLLDGLAGPAGVTGMRSVFTRGHVVEAVASASTAALDGPAVERLAQRFLGSHAAVALGAHAGVTLYSTPEILDAEARLLAWADSKPTHLHTVPDTVIDQVLAARPELSNEQTAMVRALCEPGPAVRVVAGRPGAGKTFALDAFVAALTLAGTSVVGCSVSAQAALELEAATGLASRTGRPASTMARLLVELDRAEHGGFTPGTVVIVDEASMAPTRDLDRLGQHLATTGGTLVLVGDPDQHGSVQAGGLYRHLATDTTRTIRLDDNRRQTDPVERLAITEYRDHHVAAALARYDSAGRVVRAPTAGECLDAMAADWWVNRQHGGRDPMIAGPNRTRRELNQRARVLLDAAGRLHGEPLDVNGLEFRLGDEIVARRNDPHLRLPGGPALTNGSVGTVTAIDHHIGSLTVAFDRHGVLTLAATYLAADGVDHAYARTTYGVQGATHTLGLYHPDDRAGFEEGYVALTRAATATRIYIVDGTPPVDRDLSHRRPAPVGLDTLADSLDRHRADRAAHDHNPYAAEIARLAETHTLGQLAARAKELVARLDAGPPDVTAAQAAVARRLTQARAELDQWERQHADARARLDTALTSGRKRRPDRRAVADAEHDVTYARTRVDQGSQAVTELAARSHSIELAEQRRASWLADHPELTSDLTVVRAAHTAREQRVRAAVIADPHPAITTTIGPPPLTRAERRPWERAIGDIAVQLDQAETHTPPTTTEVIAAARHVADASAAHLADHHLGASPV